MHTLEVKNLTKNIKSTFILKNINLSLKGGKIYGIVGNNGSGKTMLFRLLSGLVAPTTGKILYDGSEKRSTSIGITIENTSVFPDLSGYENLYVLSQIQKKIGKEEIINTLNRVDLNPFDTKPVKKYSLGMKQRLILAQAVMEKPNYLLLDEPMNGIDASGVELVKQIILEEKKRGAVILLSSHIGSDMDFLCDEKFRMESGALKAYESGLKK